MDPLAVAADLIRFFDYRHLPSHLQSVSEPFAVLAAHIIAATKPGWQQIRALDDLVRSKDAAVRAALELVAG